ncbi:MAG: hypothetical protein DRJ69_03535 [Thermoprotei archaeon]|nr:MAG: hypothetical protein DRJ69_03535 [Thermoprotei archaeon]
MYCLKRDFIWELLFEKIGVRRLSLIISAVFGILGAYLLFHVDYEIRLVNEVSTPSYAYYIGLVMFALAVVSFVAPIVVPPKRKIPRPPFALKCPSCGERLEFIDGRFECLKCGHVIDSSPMLVSMRDLATLVDLAVFGCNHYCDLISRYGYCSTLLKYAEFFNANIPVECPRLLKKNSNKNRVK